MFSSRVGAGANNKKHWGFFFRVCGYRAPARSTGFFSCSSVRVPAQSTELRFFFLPCGCRHNKDSVFV
nr:MAG: hypothetical protein [Molluscum contagiosum virus]WQH58170.1 MAG: hypothetical protein [Molluscum contagiosum virus]